MKSVVLFAALSVLVFGTAVDAKTVTVQVDAKAGPWSVQANPKMKFGVGDNSAPVIIAGVSDSALGKLEIYAEGTTATKDNPAVGSVGVESIEANDSKLKGKYYPSFYAPRVLYPAYAHGLVVSFVNDQGVLLSRPVMVGEGLRLPIPEGATGVAIGFNDVTFKDNSGSLTVHVNVPDE